MTRGALWPKGSPRGPWLRPGPAMIPIHALLSRIRWDKEFGRGRFELGYLDRRDGVIRRIGLAAVIFSDDDRRAFELADETGEARRIPFHRIREVYKDGRLIWRRSGPSAAP